MISRRPAQMWAICVVLWPLMCVPSSPGAPTTARGGSVDFGGREAGPQWLLATPVAAPDRRVARTPCGALDRLIVLRGGVASASAARALARGDHHMPDGGDTGAGCKEGGTATGMTTQNAAGPWTGAEGEVPTQEGLGGGEAAANGDGDTDGGLVPIESRVEVDPAWRPRIPCIPPDVSIHIDRVRREIRVLDMLGRPVNPNTGRPRELPALPVLEIEVPDSVAPGQEFIYSIAGHGDVRLRAPRAKRGLEPALGTLRRHTILALAPPPAVGAVHSRYLRGCNSVALSNGSEFPLSIPEDLDGGAEGGSGNGSLPAEVLYVPPHARFVAPPAASRALALAAAAAAAWEAASAQARVQGARTEADANKANAELAAATDALRAAKSSLGEYACGGDWVYDQERGHGLELPTFADGVWMMPKVNASEYAAVLEAALEQDSQAPWQIYLHANGSLVAHRVRGRRGKWLGNRFGHLVCTAPLRNRLVFGRYILPDVHLRMTEVSKSNGSLCFPPAPPPTPMDFWDVHCDRARGAAMLPEEGLPLKHAPLSDNSNDPLHEAGGQEGDVPSGKRRRTEVLVGDTELFAAQNEDPSRDSETSHVPGTMGDAGAVLIEEGEAHEAKDEDEEDEAVGLKLRARYGRWVSGDCISCSTMPPSPLALLWLPRRRRSEYRQYLNVSQAAARGNHEARRMLLEEYNISMLVERISWSVKQERDFNGGRLRLRYPLHAREVNCRSCNQSWTRIPWMLNARLNESMLPTTMEWFSNRKLWAHCQQGDVGEVELTLDTLPTSVLARDEDFFGGVALHHAAWCGHAAALKCLLDRGTPVSVRDDHNWTALHHACRQGHISVVQELLAAGAPVDEAGGLSGKQTPHEFRPLHWAAQMGHAAVVGLLLAHGAEVNAKEGDDSSPLFLATRWAHVATIQELLAAGACLKQRCKCGIDDSAELTAIELAERLSLVYRSPRMVPSAQEIANDTPLDVFPGWEAYEHVRNILRLALALKNSNANTSATNSSASSPAPAPTTQALR